MRGSIGFGVVSALFCASMIGACSASGNDPGGGTGTSNPDSGSQASSYGGNSDSGSAQNDSGSTQSNYDAGTTSVVDSGSSPPPSGADCDLSNPTAVMGYFTAAASGGDGACGAADACGAGDCCLNFASAAGGGSIPPAFAALFSGASASICVAE